MSEPFLAEIRLFGSTFLAEPPGTRAVFPSIVGRPVDEVALFEATATMDVVASLPTGVGVPWEVVLRLHDAETMRAWLALGQEVHQWCIDQGKADVQWALDDDGLPQIPAELAGMELPESVHTWVVGARDAVHAMSRLFPGD